MGSKGTSQQNQQQFQNQTQNQQNASATTQNQLVNTNQQQAGTQAQTQNQQGTSTYNPYAGIMSAGNQALQQAQQAASSPFQLPVAPVAGFSNDQQQAFQQYRDMQGAATPYFNQAQGLFNQSAAPISESQISQYMNPYASSILANLHESQHQQMNDMTGRATQTAGGVGASRIGVAQGEMARQQALAEGQTLSGIYGSALSAAQQDAGRQQSAAYGIGNLGGAYQNSLMQGAGALSAAGAQQQQLQQAQLNAPYQNKLAQLALPYQQAQYLAGITGSLAGALGGTTSTNQTGNTLGQTTNNTIGQTTGQNISNTLGQTYGQTSGNTLGYGQSMPAAPNMFSQLAGLGTAGAGLYGALNQGGFFGGGNDAGTINLGDLGGGGGGITDRARGGRIGYDEGGGVSGDESWMSADPTVPEIHAQPSQGHHPDVPALDMRPLPSSQAAPMPAMHFAEPQTRSPDLKWLDMRLPEQQKSSGSSGGGLGDIISTAAKIVPFFLAQGGAVGSTPYQHFDEGGDVSFDDRFNTAFPYRQPEAAPIMAAGDDEQTPLPRARPEAAPPRLPPGVDWPEIHRLPPQEAVDEERARNPGLGIPPKTRLTVNALNGGADNILNLAKDPDALPPRAPQQRQSTPEPTGLAAISPAAEQLAAKNRKEMLRQNYDLPYPDLSDHSKDTSRNFAKSPWMALISAGAGMMASTSPYAGVGIGKGLQAGVENLNKQRESSREEETVNQRAKQLAIQADKHLREYTQVTPAELISAEQKQSALEATNLQKLYENPIDGTSLWLDRNSKELKKYGPNGQMQTTPMDKAKVPPAVLADAQGTGGGGQGGAGVSGKPDTPQQAMTSISPPSGVIETRPPESMLTPAVKPAQAAETNTEMLGGFQSKAAAAQGRSASNIERKDIVKAATGADRSQYRLYEMQRDLDTVMSYVNGNGGGSDFLRASMRPGVGADKVVELAKAYDRANPGKGVPEGVLAAAVNWSKNATLAGFGGIVAEGLSAREAQPIIQASMNAVASMNLPEASSRALLASGKELAQRAKDKMEFYDSYLAKNGGIGTGWQQKFEEKFPIGSYITRAVVSALPPQERAKLNSDTALLRQTRDKFMSAERSGDGGSIDAARQQYMLAKNRFDARYGGTSNYFAFGTM